IAIVLDRLSQAIATQKPRMHVPGLKPWQRHPYLLAAIAILLGSTLVGLLVPAVAKLPNSVTVTTAPFWDVLMNWITRTFFEAIRTWLLLPVLNPSKAFLLWLPWLGVVGLLGLAGFRLGGRTLALLVVVLATICAATGLWEKTVITVYLVALSTVVACLIGMP